VRKELDNLRDKLQHLKMKYSKEKERIDEIRRLKQIREKLLFALQEAERWYDLEKVKNAIKKLLCIEIHWCTTRVRYFY